MNRDLISPVFEVGTGVNQTQKKSSVYKRSAVAMKPEIVTNAVVAALSEGAITASADAAKSPVAEAYQGLKSLIRKRFGEHSKAAVALDELEANPDSEAEKKLLNGELSTVKVVCDPEQPRRGASSIGG